MPTTKPTIRVQGHGHVETAPDIVMLNFLIGAEHREYAQTIEALNQRTTALRASLAQSGEDPEALKTTAFSVSVNNEYINGCSRFVGFRGTHALQLRLAFDQQRLDRVFSVVTVSPAHAQLSLVFTVSDPESVRRKVLAAAVANARERAQVIVAASQQKLGKIVFIEYGYTEIRVSSEPFALAVPAAAPAAPSIRPAEVESSDTVGVTWELGA